MANATFRPPRRLRWHYRSRHSGLIQFSNRLIYDDDLIVFPSATESSWRMGVELRHSSGLYKAGTNPIEANALVEAALAFMRKIRLDHWESLPSIKSSVTSSVRNLNLEEPTTPSSRLP